MRSVILLGLLVALPWVSFVGWGLGAFVLAGVGAWALGPVVGRVL